MVTSVQVSGRCSRGFAMITSQVESRLLDVLERHMTHFPQGLHYAEMQ